MRAALRMCCSVLVLLIVRVFRVFRVCCYVCVQAWEDFHELNYLGDCDFVYYFAWVVVRIFENKVLRIFNVVCDESSYLSGGKKSGIIFLHGLGTPEFLNRMKQYE